jgi:hypothetical protein
MLDAGANTLEQCRELGHDARTTAHVVFTAMLAKSDWSPALRTRKRRKPPSRPEMRYSRDHYRNLVVGPFIWYDFDGRMNYHYFRQDNPERWVRMAEDAWKDPDVLLNIARGHHYVSSRVARNAVVRVRRHTDHDFPTRYRDK